ncbi:hypothetical protein AVEN_181936-1 [Araneus ventricosus]|uniref:Uncharacterized protein n=1 Tax=Araneus ventricosus TaxID=182803 RepID=A0A4Y2TUQ1_ARAVE|nr:hypothetical protein AVEN_181936-1 [Araneus ventricosus]
MGAKTTRDMVRGLQKIMDMDVEGFSPPEPEIPSREIHKRWIYAHSASETENISIDYEKVGKWLLFFDQVQRSDETGLTEQDHAWQLIKELVETGILYKAKCSTPLKGICKAYDESNNGVICCYTSDYTNKQDVKRAAGAIRRAVHWPSDLFYKTDNDTRAGKYRHNRDDYICIYKHTVEGELYERDPIIQYQWNPVNI